jgi:hypothetical protein
VLLCCGLDILGIRFGPVNSPFQTLAAHFKYCLTMVERLD